MNAEWAAWAKSVNAAVAELADDIKTALKLASRTAERVLALEAASPDPGGLAQLRKEILANIAAECAAEEAIPALPLATTPAAAPQPHKPRAPARPRRIGSRPAPEDQ
jgi:hypothetical protein